jgi:hypothetical protein
VDESFDDDGVGMDGLGTNETGGDQDDESSEEALQS